jgi:hypothetical protein
MPAVGLAPTPVRGLSPMPLLIGLRRQNGARGRVRTGKNAEFGAAMSTICITRAWSPSQCCRGSCRLRTCRPSRQSMRRTRLVAMAGFAPARLSALRSKRSVSTGSSHMAKACGRQALLLHGLPPALLRRRCLLVPARPHQKGVNTEDTRPVQRLTETLRLSLRFVGKLGLRPDSHRRPSPYGGAALTGCATEP